LYAKRENSCHNGTTTRYGCSASARPRRFQIGFVRRPQLEALRGVPTFGPSGCDRRSTLGGRPVHDQGPSATWRKADAAPTPGGSCLYSDLWRFLHRSGRRIDPDKLDAYPPGSVIVLPGNTSHFHWAKSREYVTQVTAIGPLGLEYVSANDDPRNHNS
jgi:hypothetical protein